MIDEEIKKEFEKLTAEKQDLLNSWINKNFIKIKSINYDTSSYGLKHKFSSATGLYITNDMFKYAMFLCGFTIHNMTALNWHFNISKKSPGLKFSVV